MVRLAKVTEEARKTEQLLKNAEGARFSELWPTNELKSGAIRATERRLMDLASIYHEARPDS
jgi:hypothetical protein